jgi:lipopolysaccharide export system protein LptA
LELLQVNISFRQDIYKRLRIQDFRLDELIKKYPWVLTLKNTVIGLAIIAGLAYFITISASEAKKDLKDIFADEKSDVTLVEDVLATGYDFEEIIEDGVKKQYFGKVWELESRIVEEGSDGSKSVAKEIKVLRIFKKGELNLIGVGDEAEYNKNRDELKMYGNVHVESEDGSTILNTETLIWSDAKDNKRMSCPEPVELWIDDNHILADMMFSDKDLERIDFLGRVSMFNIGIERENFMTREGWIDFEDVKTEGERDPDDVINVECEYIHYDKIEKYMECYPYVPHRVKKRHRTYLKREDFKPAVPFKYQQQSAEKEEDDLIPESIRTTGMEGFESIFEKDDEETTSEEKNIEEKESSENKEKEIELPDRELRASPVPEPFPGKFPDRLARQVYCWKQDKKIFSNRLDINLKQKMLKPRFDVYIWAFKMEKEVKKKHEKKDEAPSKTVKALAKETTEIYGDFMNVYWKTDFIDAWGGIEIRQKEKYFTSKNMVYSDELGIMQADGDVFMEQLDGEWLEREGLLEDMTDEDAKEHAKKPTEITSDAMISYDDEDYVYMIGNVYIKQEDQNIVSNEGEFSDFDDLMVFWGNVKYRNKDGERLNADKLTLYTEENRYIAEGAVIARSLVPEEYEDDLREMEGEDIEPSEENPEENAAEVENETKSEGESGD